MQPTQFKIDQRINIVEDPLISVSVHSNNQLDSFETQIRKPQAKIKES